MKFLSKFWKFSEQKSGNTSSVSMKFQFSRDIKHEQVAWYMIKVVLKICT